PILVRGLTRKSAELGSRVSRLYWVNTLGAVAGTLLAGFVLLPMLGLRLTIAGAVALNILAGLIVLWLARRALPSQTLEAVASALRSGSPEAFPESSRFLLVSFAVVGATAIAYEVAWTRLLATTLGSSTYAFTLMLATFLAGIVLGSALFERWSARAEARHRRVSLATFATTQTCTGLAALLFLVCFQYLPAVMPPILRATHESFGGLLLAQFAASALVMLPAAVVFGFNFPAVVVLLAGTPREGAGYATAVGRAYAANTFGAIAGAVAAGFWLVPWLGAFRVVALFAGLNLVLAVLIELRSSPSRLPALALNVALITVVAFAGWTPLFYNRALAYFSTVLYWNFHESNLTLAESAATTDLLFAADGLNASVAVARTDDYWALKTNGKVDASNHDAPTQLLVGHLGAIFHPAPRRVLIIGFGSGMTASAVARYPDVERIDVAEIEPAVIQAAPYLEKLNRGVLRDPRVHVHLDDARNFLLTSRDAYDLIISEPSNPWIAGVATLFTDEYYAAIRRRLAPGGILVQWVQAYALHPADLRMILATLAKHFPETTIWHVLEPDLLVLARTDTSPLRFDRARKLWANPGLHEDFISLSLFRPESISAYFLLDDAGARRLAAGSVLNTDDLTLLEYHAPRALLSRGLVQTNSDLLREFRDGLLPVNLDPAATPAALEGAAETHLELQDTSAAQDCLNALDAQPVTSTLALLRGRVQFAQNQFSAARASFEIARDLDPDSLEGAHWLAVLEHHFGDDAGAHRLLGEILRRDANFLPALTDRMEFARDREDWPAAAQAQIARMAAMPHPAPEEYCTLGEFWLRARNLAEAERVYLRGISEEPYSYSCHRNLANLYKTAGRFAEARAHLEFVVRYFPDGDSETYSSLAEVDRALGDPRSALAVLQKGRRIFPGDSALQDVLSGK
ncbi:MAG TPA: fused MFS/spermidine synthase, partial [Candidatus Acidoferrales bacterium]|nr:fused MFS/spermidine synthase [Candidatus Acidoferrales bacterium]